MATIDSISANDTPSEAESPPLTTRLHAWVASVDHKQIGIMYLIMSLFFLILGGLEAFLIRAQLWAPNSEVVGPDTFNQLFTMHGTTMIFFVLMPMLSGFANYLVPLMIGARDVAFPRLNALGFWLSFFGGCLLYFTYFGAQGLYGAASAPDIGWFAYAPLTSPAYARGNATDYWILGTMLTGAGTISFGVNLLATIFTMRAPGMLLTKLPLFVYIFMIDAALIIIAFPPLTAAQVMLLLDRYAGAHFFDPQNGGSAVLWQHLFWFFGHPEVYILALPAFAIASEVIPVFARKVIFGYASMAAATAAIAFISLGVWVHHMFTVGLSDVVDTIFAASTFLIAIPTGIKIFNWTATLYGGRIRLKTPMLFALGFLSMFLIGGLTGIMLSVVPFDWQVSDSYFLIGHFHYVLFGGSLFSLIAGFYYWYPKMTGRIMSEKIGILQFVFTFVGFNVLFFPMHISGLLGMPRRIYTYTEPGWVLWNQLSTIGAAIMGVGFLFFFFNLIWSLRHGKLAGDDPWDAWTLEWTTPSPPPVYNFEKTPAVRSRRPLWDLKHPDDPDWEHE
ncbi:MAG: cytochrome c oxidase subunit I [Planctomycetaceae bacterium]|nr:cytochrome c oxidase subunit I [Planctomycetaceae bacterium]|tara:strand:- start:4081 stop:5760 length:1680 start_codon:yes stop_codon:yes gene_type:complete